MNSLPEIIKANNPNALYKATANGDEGIFKGVKRIADATPKGYEKTEVYFVDNSGWGREGEPALTGAQFVKKVKKGFYYGITGVGQFQIYITEFKKLDKPE